jgi:putative acetyltransferase
VIEVDDPRAADVRELLRRHLEFARATTPPEGVFALEADELADPAVTFFGYRADGELLAVGALRQLDNEHAEIKSMHTALAARGRGIGRAMVGHLLAVARERGLRRVSLETGNMAEFAPARSLYSPTRTPPAGPGTGGQRHCSMSPGPVRSTNCLTRSRKGWAAANAGSRRRCSIRATRPGCCRRSSPASRPPAASRQYPQDA